MRTNGMLRGGGALWCRTDVDGEQMDMVGGEKGGTA